MKKNYLVWAISLMLTALLVTSCGETGVNGEPADPNPDPTDVVPDPEGTISANFISGDDVYVSGFTSVRITNALNFDGDVCEFVSVGEINGLGNIVSIPSNGWANEVAVMPGNGYVARCSYYTDNKYYEYARLYVKEWIVSTTGGILGAVVKYQAHFEPRFSFETDKVELSYTGEEQELKMNVISTCKIMSKPEWCDVEMRFESLVVSANENITAEKRVGEIVLSNNTNDFVVKVTQDAADEPVFSSGYGTEVSPYVIKTAQNLISLSSGKYSTEANPQYFVQTQDIDVTGLEWNRGDFYGSFDGCNYQIKGLSMNVKDISYGGLFNTNNGNIKGVRIETTKNGLVGYYVGGICLNNCGTIAQSCFVGAISSILSAGGIVYVNNNIISECYTDVQIYSEMEYNTHIAGIAAEGSGEIENCYANLKTDCESKEHSHVVSGIGTSGQIYNCYVTGSFRVSDFRASDDPVGGDYGSSRYCYYNSETITSDSQKNGVYALSEEAMKIQSSYQTWDFKKIWTIDEGVSYPTLRCFEK